MVVEPLNKFLEDVDAKGRGKTGPHILI